VLLLCLTSILQPVWLGRPYPEYKTTSQHSYPGHWGTQSPHHEKVTAQRGLRNRAILTIIIIYLVFVSTFFCSGRYWLWSNFVVIVLNTFVWDSFNYLLSVNICLSSRYFYVSIMIIHFLSSTYFILLKDRNVRHANNENKKQELKLYDYWK